MAINEMSAHIQSAVWCELRILTSHLVLNRDRKSEQRACSGQTLLRSKYQRVIVGRHRRSSPEHRR